jgi:trehalose 6-phosphate synthase/phosphatase
VLELRLRREKLFLGVDRLDYTKGIARRLVAFERFLVAHPEWHGLVRLIQIAVPSRGRVSAYRRYRREIERLVTSINGRFATPAWTPIQYINRALEVDELLSLYRAADVMLVTPVRDGMNLVAKEFIAARSDEDGVLILSEFAGAADELVDALIVNPYDVDGVADAMHHALVMPAVERRHRLRALRAVVTTHNVSRWARDFLGALESHEPPRTAAASLPAPRQAPSY